MSGISAAEVVARTGRPILEFGRGWMLDAGTVARADQLGLPSENPFGFWVNGRAGVLGDGHASKASAAIGFMAPDRVAALWDARPATLGAVATSEAYAEAAAAWGRARLAHMSDDRLLALTELCDAVAAAAQPSVGALFAGWRALGRPDDPAGAATVALNVVRELRGGAHLSAVYAVGLGPLGAIVSTDDPVRGGPPGAERFGWTGPFPEPDPDARRRAEEITSAIVEPVFATLSADDRERFADLVDEARAGMDRTEE